ncbi:MAG: GntR family transcriptional regulator [Clostridiales bacterium]|jgi:GntR family transcriptional repressor for pyruvate dehydrogenase complex|nr:GntR family transcriptional regulator [Clostridiales bacterium]
MSDAMELKSVSHKSKSQLVLDNLKDALINGKLRPGDKLPALSEMAAQMDVGLSSIREAVKMLEALDILESRQGDGTFVSSNLRDGAFNALSLQLLLMPWSTNALVEFRSLFETAFTHLAAQNALPEDFESLEEIVSSQEALARTSTLGEKEEWSFHSRVLECTHNPYIIRTGKAMLELFLSTIPLSAEIVTKYSIAKDHRKLFEFMKAKDIAGMDKVLKKSFDGWGQRLMGNPFVGPDDER